MGNNCSNKGLKRFSLRGKTKVNTQWKLFCLIQNIKKLENYEKLASRARNTINRHELGLEDRKNKRWNEMLK
ncbi:MAG: hypothetical protein GQ582_06740 [Methyloprofundus sp.]|nr:hypothetical protein [Methyloprofundus sp.]